MNKKTPLSALLSTSAISHAPADVARGASAYNSPVLAPDTGSNHTSAWSYVVEASGDHGVSIDKQDLGRVDIVAGALAGPAG
jgi:hypothetical protein